MKQYLQSLFGGAPSTANRTVVGPHVSVDMKGVAYLNASKNRLTSLHHLSNRYKGSAHEWKIKKVYGKTRHIHDYMVSRNRLHELELFHLQHTDHFINTFTVIIEAQQFHQQHKKGRPEASKSSKTEGFFQRFTFKRLREALEGEKVPDMVRPLSSQDKLAQRESSHSNTPALMVPDVMINTFARIPYVKEEVARGLPAAEIGYTATAQEKLAFLQYVSSRLGIENITYVGNAQLSIPNSNGTVSTGLVPVIHWENFLYALNLNDFRLFPVRVYRKEQQQAK